MKTDSCILTTKDFTIVEVMLDRCHDRTGPLGTLLRRKVETATVMFRDDVPSKVVTLSSRVTYRVDGREPDSRIISPDQMTSPVGLYLPITTLLGLALLGLTEGQQFVFEGHEGEERVLLESVLYQPEAARREREMAVRQMMPDMRRAALRVVPGA